MEDGDGGTIEATWVSASQAILIYCQLITYDNAVSWPSVVQDAPRLIAFRGECKTPENYSHLSKELGTKHLISLIDDIIGSHKDP